ncbi:DUF4244 domain-containing protein [Streptomyces sp. C10-9-1]|uniref:DUF4244 domain-containing protein n=1 Tax=Streptomyces sp. C10-9-1 TaxID=1859285 RepID=UPI003D7620BB
MFCTLMSCTLRTFRRPLRRNRRPSAGTSAALLLRVRGRVAALRGDRGMTTSEYAMGTIAACAFAAVLYKVVTSGAVTQALEAVIGRALDVQF